MQGWGNVPAAASGGLLSVAPRAVDQPGHRLHDKLQRILAMGAK